MSDAHHNECMLKTVKTLFISDIHLGTRGCQAAALLDFLTPEARTKVLGANAARMFGFKTG